MQRAGEWVLATSRHTLDGVHAACIETLLCRILSPIPPRARLQQRAGLVLVEGNVDEVQDVSNLHQAIVQLALHFVNLG